MKGGKRSHGRGGPATKHISGVLSVVVALEFLLFRWAYLFEWHAAMMGAAGRQSDATANAAVLGRMLTIT